MEEQMDAAARRALENRIGELLDAFYQRRLEKLKDLDLGQTLKRKNPYLYRAIGVNDSAEFVGEILKAFISSSDETLFGSIFFEPVAKAAVEAFGTGRTSSGGGCDVEIETPTTFSAYAVKSGIASFNGQSKTRQKQEFEALGKRLAKLRKHFDPVIGYAYGKKRQSVNSEANYRELAGQTFWEEITKDPDFYLKIIELMRDKPQQHALAFASAFNEAKNRLVAEFSGEYVDATGKIDWKKVTEFVSAEPVKKGVAPKGAVSNKRE
jgi:hypothetical protein